ncbi:MAG: DMT family transporter [Anaerolineaceae bacterium]|nr:DMT family transporter [Anaerolineaceae bacterium]
MFKQQLNQQKSELLLAAVILARSTSFVLSKTAMNSLTPFNLLAVRFLTAFAFLAILFGKKLVRIQKTELKYGFLLGVLFTIMMGCELTGLRATDSATTSFIENSAMIFVPILQFVFMKKKLKGAEGLRIALAVSGIAFLTLGASGGLLRSGCVYLLGSAIFYASAILLTNIASRKGDPLMIGITQVFTIGFLSLIMSFILEQPRLPQGTSEWGMVLGLAIICSGFGFTLQPVAQRGTTAERAGMMCALSPLSASLQGVILLNDQMSPYKLAGCLMILLSLLVPVLLQSLHKPLTRRPVFNHS